MKHFLFKSRTWVAAGLAVVLAGCQVVPKTGPDTTGPVDEPTPEPTADALPTDETRHRIALLVPLAGNNGDVGQSIANATTMALLDTSADNLRITTYDTSRGPRDAARKAIADGNKLILGPLMSDNVGAVLAEARPADVPLISFSNDTGAAAVNAFVMGHIPEQSVARSIAYARRQGATQFAALLPTGNYGDRAFSALKNSLRNYGGSLVATQRYDRGNANISAAARRLSSEGGFDTVLVADGARLSVQAALALRNDETRDLRLIGTELWSGVDALNLSSSMNGALFSAVSDARYQRFADSYKSRFGDNPYRISTLGYDAVLLMLRVARDWRVGRDFPVSQLRDSGGFLGLDGPFRFRRNGVVERSMEVRQIQANGVAVVDAAPSRFDD
ncbi:penicillin-binding protein activator [Altererythrobacter lutimaris]|uniref:Penicillin-binding protein activator n=1 Tax=Altererythrobacter lutimaris TaxID=2743979 RepID=A0A850HBU6_9SPHN|nr:penicillin-binding protein activator [Altererythrobacter lutimaris]NVE94058.1 penicillin-binding protein activator [Altererythrobacter lutimaris]